LWLFGRVPEPFFGTSHQLLIIIGHPKHFALQMRIAYFFSEGAGFFGPRRHALDRYLATLDPTAAFYDLSEQISWPRSVSGSNMGALEFSDDGARSLSMRPPS
jgi:hypothetical protein